MILCDVDGLTSNIKSDYYAFGVCRRIIEIKLGIFRQIRACRRNFEFIEACGFLCRVLMFKIRTSFLYKQLSIKTLPANTFRTKIILVRLIF